MQSIVLWLILSVMSSVKFVCYFIIWFFYYFFYYDSIDIYRKNIYIWEEYSYQSLPINLPIKNSVNLKPNLDKLSNHKFQIQQAYKNQKHNIRYSPPNSKPHAIEQVRWMKSSASNYTFWRKMDFKNQLRFWIVMKQGCTIYVNAINSWFLIEHACFSS
jgi:hypothetical protein